MITEKGTVKLTTVHNEDLNRELNRPSKILGIVYTVTGGIMLFLYILLAVLSDEEISAVDREAVAFNIFLMAAGAVLLVIGILFIATYVRVNKLKGVETKSEENEFFKDYLINREHVNGEHIATAKVYYSRILRVKETNNYIFIYNTRVTALSVDKRGVPLNELNAIRALLSRRSAGVAGGTATPKAQAPQPDQAQPKIVEEAEVAKTEVQPTEEVKAEEVKTEEVKNEEVKTEEVKNEEVKTEEVKTEEVKTNDQPNQE